MDDLIIRTARLEDATDIAGLLRATRWFGRMESESPGDTSARILTHLRLCLSDDSHSVLVAVEVAGKVYGYLSVHWLPYLFLPGPEGFVSELFVHPDARGQGIGKRLLAGCVEAARQRGCCRLQLMNGRQRDSYQRRFYERNGWVEREGMANFIYPLE